LKILKRYRSSQKKEGGDGSDGESLHSNVELSEAADVPAAATEADGSV